MIQIEKKITPYHTLLNVLLNYAQWCKEDKQRVEKFNVMYRNKTASEIRLMTIRTILQFAHDVWKAHEEADGASGQNRSKYEQRGEK